LRSNLLYYEMKGTKKFSVLSESRFALLRTGNRELRTSFGRVLTFYEAST
jgi:hypothetical protein